MPTFYYEGKIEPDVVPLTIDYRPVVIRRESRFAPDAEFEVAVFVGRLRIRVTTDRVDEQVVHDLYLPAWDCARALVDTAGFIDAIPYAVTIDRVVMDDGEVKAFALGDRSLAAAHDFSADDLERLADVFMGDLPMALAVSDLLMTLGKAHYSPIACGRVTDGIARLMAPDLDGKARWAVLRETLRVDEDYLRSLTNVSRGSRHADREEVPAEINRETAHRLWKLFGRFLRYRVDGTLAPERFPVLEGKDAHFREADAFAT